MAKEYFRTLSAVFPIILRREGGRTQILLHLRQNTGYMDGTFAALCSPTAPAISRSKQAMQKPMLPGFPSAVSASAASPTATPAARTSRFSFFMWFSPFCVILT